VLCKCDATTVLLDSHNTELMAAIQEQAIVSKIGPLNDVSIEISRVPIDYMPNVKKDANLVIPAERPALLLLTSGTSGPPKIVVHSRRIFYAQPEPYGGPTDVFLFHRPVFWIGGIRILLAIILKGVKIEIICYKSKADVVWQRLQRGDITMMFLPVSLLSNMMREYEGKLCLLPDETLQLYHKVMGSIRYMQCTGGLVPVRIKKFWKKLLTCTSLEVNYAGTEVGTAGLGFKVDSSETAEVSQLDP